MLSEDKFDFLPLILNLFELRLHLGFLTGLIGDLFYIISNFAELQVIDVRKLEVGVNDEVVVDLFADHVPMAFTHRWFTKLANERKELKPFFDFLEETNVRIALLVDLHLLEGSFELLDLFLHFVRLGTLPSVIHVSLEDSLALSDVVPKTLHKGDFVLDLCDLDLRSLNGSRVLKFLSIVSELSCGFNLFIDLGSNILQTLERGFATSVIFVEIALLHIGNILLELFFVAGNHSHVSLALSIAKRSNLFLDILGKFLETLPIILELLSVFDLLILGDTMGLEECKRLSQLVQDESSGIVLGVHHLNAGLHTNESLNIAKILILGLGSSISLFDECLH